MSTFGVGIKVSSNIRLFSAGVAGVSEASAQSYTVPAGSYVEVWAGTGSNSTSGAGYVYNSTTYAAYFSMSINGGAYTPPAFNDASKRMIFGPGTVLSVVAASGAGAQNFASLEGVLFTNTGS